GSHAESPSAAGNRRDGGLGFHAFEYAEDRLIRARSDNSVRLRPDSHRLSAPMQQSHVDVFRLCHFGVPFVSQAKGENASQYVSTRRRLTRCRPVVQAAETARGGRKNWRRGRARRTMKRQAPEPLDIPWT